MTYNTEKTNDLKNTLLAKIEEEKLTPRSKWFFVTQECFVWGLWGLSIIVGSLAVAVSLFVISHRQYSLYEATHENFLTFIIEALPYLWFLVFAVMVYMAFYNLRHTKNGYKYSVSVIIASSVVLSMAGGATLQFFGFGFFVDNMLGKNMEMYVSQAKLESKIWQQPREGRLIGRQVLSTVSPTTTLIFEDVQGSRWTMNITELTSRDIELLQTMDKVRLLGKMTDEKLHLFYACGVFPWVMEKPSTKAEMLKIRKEFVEEINEHIKRSKMVMNNESEFNFTEDSVCANLAAARRVPVRP